ncbi:hypothetical protein HPB52_022882 [Rhipicephalus sanguineus]|uniref:CCHC-type domain-containing protein n=1 Tax=Rhipicephalus sanguineus TaxID=34632 RepID=A0A9D4Q4A0_RHISA|nr:hypothetical protein HPB52_022882 [Rhipicephalus sanguineus]
MLKSKEMRTETQKQGLEGKGPRPTVNPAMGPMSKVLKNTGSNEDSAVTDPTQGTKTDKIQKKKTKKVDQKQMTNKGEKAKKEPQGAMLTKASPETDWWSPTENEQVEGGSPGTEAEEAEGGEVHPQTQPAANEGALDNWDEDRTSQSSLPTSRGEKGSVLSRLSKAVNNTMRALIKISTLTGGDEAVAQQIEATISEQAKLKNLLLEQAQQIAFQKGRIEELEKRRQEEPFEQREEPTQSNTPVNESRPTYALVVSSGTMEKKEVASLLKQRVDPLDLGIQEATIRPGREGIVVTTKSKENSAKILQFIQNDREMRNVKAKLPQENRIHKKVIGLEDEIDEVNLPARIVMQNRLARSPEDITIKKTWPGKRGKTVILALNRSGNKAIGSRTALNIGWSRCPIFDIFWPRCTRCAMHGHIAPDCDGPQRCINCGQRGHHCNICETEGGTETDHYMMSRECPVYIAKVQAEKSRILARLN